MQAKQLQYGLQSSHQQSNVLNTELQHRCDQVEELTRDHNALLSKFRELTVLMSEAHNKLNSAVAQSGKAMAKDHTKVSKMLHTHILLLTAKHCVDKATYIAATVLTWLYATASTYCIQAFNF